MGDKRIHATKAASVRRFSRPATICRYIKQLAREVDWISKRRSCRVRKRPDLPQMCVGLVWTWRLVSSAKLIGIAQAGKPPRDHPARSPGIRTSDPLVPNEVRGFSTSVRYGVDTPNRNT